MKKTFLIVIAFGSLLISVNSYSMLENTGDADGEQQVKRIKQSTTASVTDGGVKSGGGQGGSQQDTAKVSTTKGGKKRVIDSLPPVRKNKRLVIKH